MLVEEPIENLADIAEAAETLLDRVIDWVDLSWSQCGRRAQRLRSRGGRELRLLLRLGVKLRHGDVLLKTSDAVVVVNVVPCEVLVASPGDAAQLATIAFELGNLHAPMQLVDAAQRIITVCDGPTQRLLERIGVPYELQTRRFEPTLRSAEASIVPADDFEFIRK